MRNRLLLLLVIACAPADRSSDTSTDSAAIDSVKPDPTAAAAPAPPNELPVIATWRTRIPASALVRPGACPFECCVYGSWRVESEVPVYDVARRDAPVLYTLRAGQPLRADSGKVLITGLQLIAVQDTLRTWLGAGSTQLVPGDTLVLLDAIGEGNFNVWHDGRVQESEGFWAPPNDTLRVVRIGSYQADWWVHATLQDGRSGWFLADSVRLRGADACAGPE